MFTDAATYPTSGPDALKTILIGGVLTILSVFILPLFLLVGYTVRVVRSVADDEARPPAFDDWGAMFVDGVKGFAITVAYFLIPAAIFAGFAVMAALLAPTRVAGIVVVVGALAILPLALVVWYVATAGFLNFAVTGRLGAAFAMEDLRPTLASGSFATGWLVGFGVLVVGSVVGGIVGAIPIVGILSAFVLFYTTVSMTYCYARGFAAATAVASTPDAPTVDPAA